MPSDSVLIVAAEESSAVYAKRILEIWKTSRPKVQAFGVGNAAMEKIGFERLGKAEEMAVIGIVEVLKHYKEIRGVFYNLINEAEKRQIKFALLIDYPDFNLRLAKQLKKRGITVVYYISPTVWAWRQKRIEQIKKYVDKMLLIYPFEADFYKQHQMNFEFVGHPLLDEVSEDLLSAEKIQLQKKRLGLGPQDRLLGLMPGSRKSEIRFHLQDQIGALKELQKKIPNLYGALLLAPSLSKSDILPYLDGHIDNFMILQDEPFKMLQATDAVLVASGTATLVVALMQKPMIIMYKMNSLTAWLAKKLVKGVKHFGIVNLIFKEEVAPELFQKQVNPLDIATAAELLFDETFRQQQIAKWKAMPEKLGQTGAGKRVVRALDEYF